MDQGQGGIKNNPSTGGVYNGGVGVPGGSPIATPPSVNSSGTMPTGNDIVFDSSDSKSSKKNKKAWLVLVVFLVLGIIGLCAGLMLKNNGIVTSDDEVENEILAVMEENYDFIEKIQKKFINIKNGKLFLIDFFGEKNREGMNEAINTMEEFWDGINNIDVERIVNVNIKDDLSLLKESLGEDIEAYRKTITLYNLFSEYINEEDRDPSSLIALEDEKVNKILDDVNVVIQNPEAENPDNYEDYYKPIVKDIFSVYTDYEGFGDTEYYRYIGKIIGNINDERDGEKEKKSE